MSLDTALQQAIDLKRNREHGQESGSPVRHTDRRSEERVYSSLRAVIELPHSDEQIDCQVCNISDNGAKLRVRDAACLPSSLRVHIPLRGWKRDAFIKWRADNYIGVEFIHDSTLNLLQRIDLLETEVQEMKQRLSKL